MHNTRLHPVFYMTLDEIGDRITPDTSWRERRGGVRRPYIVPADYMTLEEMYADPPETLHEETGWGLTSGKYPVVTTPHARPTRDRVPPRSSYPPVISRAGSAVLLGLPFDDSIPSRGRAKMGPKAFGRALPSHATFGRGVELAEARLSRPRRPRSARHQRRRAMNRLQAASRESSLAAYRSSSVATMATGAIIRGLAEARPDKTRARRIDSHYDVRG